MKKVAIRRLAPLTSLLFIIVAVSCTDGTSLSSIISSNGSVSSEISYSMPSDGWTYSNRVMYVRDHSMVTGPNAFTNTVKAFNLTGTDLGFSYFDESIGRFYAVYGDTASNGVGVWNSNMTLYTDDLDFSKGINWQGMLPGSFGAYSQVTPVSQKIASENGYTYNSSLITSTAVTTTIPTGAAVVNGVYYLFYMEVGQFQDNGEWDVYASGVVKSVDKGMHWAVVPGLRWISKNAAGVEGNAKNFGQIYPLVADDHLYIYGIPGGRSGGVQIGRVTLDKLEDYSSYEYFVKKDSKGNPVWAVGDVGLNTIKKLDSSYIVSPSCGELCVTYEPYLQRYMMTYMQSNSQIVMRRSVTPYGDWSASDVFMKQSDLSGLYGGMTSPALFFDGGKKIYLMVSEWWPTYNVHLIEVVFN